MLSCPMVTMGVRLAPIQNKKSLLKKLSDLSACSSLNREIVQNAEVLFCSSTTVF